MMAFSAMMDGPSNLTLAPMIMNAIPKVFSLLKDPN